MSKDQKYPFRAMATMSSLISAIAGPIIIGVFLGKWLDGTFQSAPLFLIICLLLGLTAGVFGALQIIRKYLGEDHE